MAITFLEAGTAATYGLEFYASVVGTVTSDSGTVHTGLRSLKVGTYSQAFTPTGVVADAGTRISFYMNMAALSSSKTDMIGPHGGSGYSFVLGCNSTGKLLFRDASGVETAGTFTVTAGVWIRICLAYTITSPSVNHIKIYVNGTIDIDVTNATMNASANELTFNNGGIVYGPPATGGIFFSDIYVDGDSTLADTGDIRVTAKLPSATNTNGFDTTGGSGAVNERPLSTTNFKQHAAISDVQQNYTLETAAGGDVDVSAATLVGRCAWLWAKGAAGGAGTPKIMDNGTETAIVLTSSAALFSLRTTSSTYPSNAAGIGMRSTNNADDTFLYECGTLLAYTPAVAAAAATTQFHERLIGRNIGKGVLR